MFPLTEFGKSFVNPKAYANDGFCGSDHFNRTPPSVKMITTNDLLSTFEHIRAHSTHGGQSTSIARDRGTEHI